MSSRSPTTLPSMPPFKTTSFVPQSLDRICFGRASRGNEARYESHDHKKQHHPRKRQRIARADTEQHVRKQACECERGYDAGSHSRGNQARTLTHDEIED